MKDTALATAREAAQRLARAEEMRRRSEADKVEALCDLAVAYDLDDEELFIEVLLDNKVQIGGTGTPLVSEMVSLEIAALLGIPAISAASELSAALNLKYRHPRLFEAVINLEIEVDRALMMSTRCHDLHPILLDEVTDAWLRQQAKLTWTGARNLIDQLLVQADPALAEKKERHARSRRGVWLWGLDQGVMNLTGVLDVLDAKFLDARLTELAGLLEPQFPELTADQRRAKAAGVLANPAYALALLQEAAQPELLDQDLVDLLGTLFHNGDRDRTAADTPAQGAEAAHLRGLSRQLPALSGQSPALGGQCTALWGQGTAPTVGTAAAATACGLGTATPYSHEPGCGCPDQPRTRRLDPHECAGHHCSTIQVPVAKLRPTLGIAVHINSDALGHLDPAARVEKAGTITTSLLAELLGEGNGIDVKVQPVIDLPNLAPADRYVPSKTMRCGIVLAFPYEPFPFSQRSSEGLDVDHTVAFQSGKPGQTRVGNLAPLTRKVHRAKTAGYWVMHQPEPGRVQWRSPLGYRYDVTPFGTERCPVICIDDDDSFAA
ncbi:MAG: DUF222 domain-containing protein [Arachnia sp.]